MRRTLRHPRVQRQALERERCWAVVWAGWRELAHWQYLASDLSSLLVRSWRHWLELELEAQ